MLIKYQLRKKEVKRKILRKKNKKELTVYLLIYRAGGPVLADCGAVFLSQITSEWVVIYLYEYQLHSVGYTIAVYFHYYVFCMSFMP